MSFPKTILRGENVSGLVTVNSDTSPASLTGGAAAAYASKDNCWAPAVVNESGALARQLTVVAKAPGGVATFSLEVSVYDADNELWYVAASITGASVGTAIAVNVPIPGGKDRASAPNPVYAFVATFPGAPPPDGRYQVILAVDYGAGVNQAVSGTVLANQGAAGASAWPVTDAGLATGAAKFQQVDAAAHVAPSGDVAARAGYVIRTDGTNVAPTMDAVARAGFVRVTDGTNSMPTMDVVARAGFVRVTDGTNSMPTMDAVARAGFVRVTDGTNSMPTMDAAARPGFQKVTDGTNVASVKAASTAGAFTDVALAVEIRPGGSFPAKGTAAMAASIPVTIASDDTLTAAMKADLDKIPSKGTAAMSGSTPMTLATDDTQLANAPGISTVAITPSDSTDLTSTVKKGIWVGVGGDVALKMTDGTTADAAATTWKNVPSGTFIEGHFARVMATNTTATNVIGKS